MAKPSAEEPRGVAVKTVTLTIGTKELTLTVDEARRLLSALTDLLGERIIVKEVQRDTPHWWYTQPWVIGPGTWRPGEVWCSGARLSGIDNTYLAKATFNATSATLALSVQ